MAKRRTWPAVQSIAETHWNPNEIFHEDAVFHDPKGGIFRGRDEIDRIAGAIKSNTSISNISPSSLQRN
jgi:hypothetical protein